MLRRLFKKQVPRCPIRPEIKDWIEARFGWLVGEFGWERLRGREMVLPTPEYFPDDYQGSPEDARKMFERTCEYMELEPSKFELHFFTPQETDAQFNPRLLMPTTDWAGLYAQQDSEPTAIWLATSQLDDPHAVVATFAHELAHAHLLGGKRMEVEEEDMEPVTDLATVFFGLGIFGANTSFRETRNFEWTSYALQGYLSTEMWSYALALYAWVREEPKPDWLRFLNTDMKSRVRHALTYLSESEDVEIVAQAPAEGIPSIEPFRDEFSGLQPSFDETELAGDTDNHPTEESAEESFTAGVLYSQAGQWVEAVDAFTAALQQNPNDGEILEQRAWAYLELGQIAEALADAELAVQLNPNDNEVYRARGVAYVESEKFEQAISDLDKYLREEDLLACDGKSATRAYYFRGIAHASLGNHKRAVTDYTHAIRCYASWSKPYEARAKSYDQLGKTKEAERDRAAATSRGKI